MKKIFIARHSHTEEHSIFGKDFERKLTPNGKNDAAAMANKIKNYDANIDLIITSNATRALQTAELYNKELNCTLIQEASLYNASSATIQHILEQLNDDVNTVLLVAHNPGVTNYINSLQIVSLDNMPTSGVFGFESATNTWSAIHTAEKKLCFFDYPGKM